MDYFRKALEWAVGMVSSKYSNQCLVCLSRCVSIKAVVQSHLACHKFSGLKSPCAKATKIMQILFTVGVCLSELWWTVNTKWHISIKRHAVNLLNHYMGAVLYWAICQDSRNHDQQILVGLIKKASLLELFVPQSKVVVVLALQACRMALLAH